MAGGSSVFGIVYEIAVLEPLEIRRRVLSRLYFLVMQTAKVVPDLVAGHDELTSLGDPPKGLHGRLVRPDGRYAARPAVRLGEHQESRVGRVPGGLVRPHRDGKLLDHADGVRALLKGDLLDAKGLEPDGQVAVGVTGVGVGHVLVDFGLGVRGHGGEVVGVIKTDSQRHPRSRVGPAPVVKLIDSRLKKVPF